MRKRLYTTDYGLTKGYCASPHGAIRSAVTYLMEHGQKHATIERPDGPPIDVWWTGVWGVVVAERKGSTKLRRVA